MRCFLCRQTTAMPGLLMLALTLSLTCLLGVASPTELSPMFGEAVAVHNKSCEISPKCFGGVGVPPIAIPPTTDNSSETDDYESNYTKKCCGSCSCEDDCFVYGTCCLNLYDDFDTGRQHVENTRYSCVTPEYIVRKPKDYKSPKSEWMISRCGQGAYDTEIIEKCENPEFDTSLKSLIPVTDTTSHIIYRNVFCTQCNTVTGASFKSWGVKIGCDGNFAPAKNMLDEMNKAQCTINFIRVDNTLLRHCNKPSYSISTCNETGQWQKYDELTNTACNSFVDQFNFTFKNYFCYLCNVHTPVPVEDFWCLKDKPSKVINDFLPSFSAIVDINILSRWEDDEILHCDATKQFADYKMMKCWDIYCNDHRHLSDGDCIFEENLITSTCYAVFLKAVPTESFLGWVVKDTKFLTDFRNYLSLALPYSGDVLEQVGLFLDKGSISQRNVQYFYLYLLLKTPILIELNNKTDVVKSVFNTLADAWVNFETQNVAVRFDVDLTESAYTMTSAEVEALSRGETLPLRNGWEPENVDQLGEPTCPQKQIMTLSSKVILCPFIKIGFGELSMVVENDFLVVNETGTQLRNSEYEKHGEEIYMCLEDYKSFHLKLSPRPYARRSSISRVEADPKNILSFVCVCLSLVCLLITLFTYLAFKELQTQPGINTIILCLCLLLAQGLFQFGAGQSSLSNWACSLIGVLCHFLWLSVMFSMNVCSIQIYLTFIKSRKISPTFSPKQTAIYTTYIILASLFFVGVNIIVSLISNGGHEIGYGGTICYLTSDLMQVVTFLIPTAVVLSSNIVLFGLVVYKITKTGQATSSLHQNKSYLLVYARLSALTGFTWILGLFQILFNSDVIEYLFILFNASQGVFVMVAFVLNQRVRNLFCPTLRKKRTKSLTYHSTVSTAVTD